MNKKWPGITRRAKEQVAFNMAQMSRMECWFPCLWKFSPCNPSNAQFSLHLPLKGGGTSLQKNALPRSFHQPLSVHFLPCISRKFPLLSCLSHKGTCISRESVTCNCALLQLGKGSFRNVRPVCTYHATVLGLLKAVLTC